MTYTAQTPLGELFRIGDIIQQELGGFQSRRICTLAASTAVKKGQVLGGDFVNGSVGTIGVNEVQTVSVGAMAMGSGTFVIRLTNAAGVEVQTDILNYNDNAATIQAAIAAALGGTVGVIVGTVSGGSASTPMLFTVTFSGTGYAGLPQQPIKVDVISGSTGASVQVGSVTRTTPSLQATCIALEAKASAVATQSILCLVRIAEVKPGYLSYGSSVGTTAAAIAAAALQLESNSGLIVMKGPTYTTSPDASLTESTTDEAGYPGL